MRILFVILLFSVMSSAMPLTKYRLYLKDKSGSSIDDRFVSDRSLNRRRVQMVITDSLDYPVSPVYLDVLRNAGYQLVTMSKWMNTVVIISGDDELERLQEFPFVESVQKVWRNRLEVSYLAQDSSSVEYVLPAGNDVEKQISMHNGDRLHDMGYTGDGVMIAVIDAGFQNADKISHINRTVLGAKDFIYESSNPYSTDRHGTNVLSIISCDNDNLMTGSASGASFWLLRSEYAASEFPVEEDYWIAAAEFADSIGADIINSSLAYNEFEDFNDYGWSHIDGKSTFITKGANIAVSKGLFVVNSAGNEGNKKWQKLCFPGDAPDVLTVGSINRDKELSDFSSKGFIKLKSVKPDIVAVGYNTYVIKPTGEVGKNSGTSFSAPVITGLVACIKQAFPEASNKMIIDFIRQSSTLYGFPDTGYGYGIPDFYEVYTRLNSVMSVGECDDDTGILEIKVNDSTLKLIVPSDSDKDICLKLYSLSGQIVENRIINRSEATVIEGLAKGLWLLEVSADGFLTADKFFIR